MNAVCLVNGLVVRNNWTDDANESQTNQGPVITTDNCEFAGVCFHFCNQSLLLIFKTKMSIKIVHSNKHPKHYPMNVPAISLRNLFREFISKFCHSFYSLHYNIEHASFILYPVLHMRKLCDIHPLATLTSNAMLSAPNFGWIKTWSDQTRISDNQVLHIANEHCNSS